MYSNPCTGKVSQQSLIYEASRGVKMENGKHLDTGAVVVYR